MCGIAGVIGNKAETKPVERMIRALSHRGPDESGLWEDSTGGAILGHTRLSIIDLSSAGHQPMTHGNGRYWITFNGEIYNYQDLHKELENDGVKFASHSDTEVILAAFAMWGTKCFERLRGMFALALWDRQDRRLVLARDRLGIKPLLWAKTSDGLIFASEIKAILTSGLVEAVIEPRAIFDLLATGSVCQPGTMIRGVQALEPGACLVVEPNNVYQRIRYWDAAEAAARLRPELAKLSYEESVHNLRERFDEACRYHLVSDVTVGSFLSGGIDSTAVTALMSQHMNKKVKTFSLGFESTPKVKNELGAAKLAAHYIGCEHTEIILTDQDISEGFDELVCAIDQPSHDGTNTYFVSRAARQAVKVVLSGLGGDEFFAGYPHFRWLQDASKRQAQLSDYILSALHRFRPNRFSRISELRCHKIERRYADTRRACSDSAIAASLADSLLANFQPGFLEAYIMPFIDWKIDPISQASLVEGHHYLRNTLLRDVDAMSMRHGLEVRPVLLDHVLVEYALALLPDMKIREGRSKAILIDAVRDLLPLELLEYPKVGFVLPQGLWLRTILRDRLIDCLDSSWAHRVFTSPFLVKMKRNIDNEHETELLWTLLILISWADKYHCVLPG